MQLLNGQGRLGKRVFFGIVGASFLFVLWHNERFLVNPGAPVWAYFNPIRWQLIPHGVGGAVALLLGAAQFSTQLRTRHPRIHRNCGKAYIVGVLILAPVAVWMALIVSPWFLIVFTVVQASSLLLFTLAAYACIRRRDFAAHREWMVRSYGVLLIFLEGRVLMAIPALKNRGMDAIVLVNWGCLAVTLVASECFLRWQQLFPRRATPLVQAGVNCNGGDAPCLLPSNKAQGAQTDTLKA
jgi:hypothetical protein